MPPLQPHEPRVRYRPGVKAWCENQAAENTLGGGWSRVPQPFSEAREPVIPGDIVLDIDTMVETFVKRKGGWPKGRARKKRA